MRRARHVELHPHRRRCSATSPRASRISARTSLQEIERLLGRLRQVWSPQPHLRRPLPQHRRMLSKERCIEYASPARCCAPPACRYDLRKAEPYLVYDEIDFDVPVGDDRRQLRPLPRRAGGVGAVDSHRPPVPARAASGTRGSPSTSTTRGCAGRPRTASSADGGADPAVQGRDRGHQGARGRGLRGGRVRQRRARLLHRVGWHGKALQGALPPAELHQHAAAARDGAWAACWPTSCPPST